MTKQEALAYMHEVTRLLVSATKEEHKDKVFEAHSIAIECIEKQMPKPVVDNEEVSGFFCPTCGRLVVAYNNGKLDYCHRCGQKLNWGDVE